MSSDAVRYELRCRAPSPRDRTRTCGKFLGNSPVPAKWAGAFKRSKDDEPGRLCIFCGNCKHFNLYDLENGRLET